MFLLSQLIDNAAERFSGRVAIRLNGKSLSYEELARQSNGLARLLITQGVARGDRVGIYMHKTLESIVAVYGVLKAGAAYVPLDPFAPTPRLTRIIRDCGVRCLVTENLTGLQGLLTAQTELDCVIGVPSPEGLPLRCIPWEEVHRMPDGRAPDVSLTDQDLAYIFYTSGSTGDPKGIMHTHRSSLSFVEWAAQTYSLRVEDRLSSHSPLHFDLSTFDLFAGAMAGATTVIIPEDVAKFPASVSELISDEKLTVWYSVPFALVQLLLRGALATRDLLSLRWVLFAGEPFPVKHLHALMTQLPRARFSNLYGPTETNVCTFYHVPPLVDDADTSLPIGRPCTNVELLVIDSDDQPVAPGEIGELLVCGPVVMQGYWGRPDLTARAFYPCSVSGHSKDFFYRTGDLVQLLPDGNYKFLGRKDRQVKCRGYRIELDEIQATLLTHDHVQAAAAYAIPGDEGSTRIEVAVVVEQGKEMMPAELVSYLAGRLPSYAIPSKVNLVNHLPLTSTGKTDWQKLRADSMTQGQLNLTDRDHIA